MKKLLTAFALLLLFIASPVWSACHLYVVPKLGSGAPGKDPYRPKYLSSFIQPGSYIFYGAQAIYLVAVDVDATTDATISADSQVTKIPDNLDSTVGAGALTTVRNKLEAANIPAVNWVVASTTYRSLTRTVINMFRFMSRLVHVTGWSTTVISGAVTLDTTFGSLNATVRQKLIDAATSLSFDTSGFTGATTVRQLLKGAADQFGNGQVKLQCVVI